MAATAAVTATAAASVASARLATLICESGGDDGSGDDDGRGSHESESDSGEESDPALPPAEYWTQPLGTPLPGAESEEEEEDADNIAVEFDDDVEEQDDRGLYSNEGFWDSHYSGCRPRRDGGGGVGRSAPHEQQQAAEVARNPVAGVRNLKVCKL